MDHYTHNVESDAMPVKAPDAMVVIPVLPPISLFKELNEIKCFVCNVIYSFVTRLNVVKDDVGTDVAPIVLSNL